MPRLTLLALVCAGALTLALAGQAVAAPSPIADCNANGRLTAHYTPAQLRHALATMPADVKEYTDCYDVIQRAMLSELGQLHGSGTGKSGGSLLPTPVLIVLIVLIAGAAALGGLALRNRASRAEPGGGPPPPAV